MNLALLIPTSFLALAVGCSTSDARLMELERHNSELLAELERLQSEPGEPGPELRVMPSFVVGLAAAEREFDAGAFEMLLSDSLAAAAGGDGGRVARESEQREVDKIRGMLLQQYLASAEIPVRITNLAFKLRDLDNEFKIGERVVSRADVEAAPADGGTAVHAVYREPIAAVMRRDQDGSYFIPYEELGGGSGRIAIQTSDAEILGEPGAPRSARQGDISFNWSLDLKEIAVYRVDGFRGDVAQFLDNMRYSGVESPIAQYQTMRDAVFLFGYGRYMTRLVNQIRTPPYITSIEVAMISQQDFDSLQGRLTEDEVLETVGSTQWVQCEFVDFADGEKIWERPAAIPFPFISRQVSGDGERVFYLKYGSRGAVFIGDYGR